jgi:hypothetical protein
LPGLSSLMIRKSLRRQDNLHAAKNGKILEPVSKILSKKKNQK